MEDAVVQPSRHCNVTSTCEVLAFIPSRGLSKSAPLGHCRGRNDCRVGLSQHSLFFFSRLPRGMQLRSSPCDGASRGGSGTIGPGGRGLFSRREFALRGPRGMRQETDLPRAERASPPTASTITCASKSCRLKQKTASAYHERVKRNKTKSPRPEGRAVPYSATKSLGAIQASGA